MHNTPKRYMSLPQLEIFLNETIYFNIRGRWWTPFENFTQAQRIEARLDNGLRLLNDIDGYNDYKREMAVRQFALDLTLNPDMSEDEQTKILRIKQQEWQLGHPVNVREVLGYNAAGVDRQLMQLSFDVLRQWSETFRRLEKLRTNRGTVLEEYYWLRDFGRILHNMVILGAGLTNRCCLQPLVIWRESDDLYYDDLITLAGTQSKVERWQIRLPVRNMTGILIHPPLDEPAVALDKIWDKCHLSSGDALRWSHLHQLCVRLDKTISMLQEIYQHFTKPVLGENDVEYFSLEQEFVDDVLTPEAPKQKPFVTDTEQLSIF